MFWFVMADSFWFYIFMKLLGKSSLHLGMETDIMKEKTEVFMKEIEVNSNNTGLRVFINGVPDLTQVPKEIGKTVINTLEAEIAEWMELKPEETTVGKSQYL